MPGRGVNSRARHLFVPQQAMEELLQPSKFANATKPTLSEPEFPIGDFFLLSLREIRSRTYCWQFPWHLESFRPDVQLVTIRTLALEALKP